VKRGAVYLVSQDGAQRHERVWEEEQERWGLSSAILRPVVLVSREAINRHSAVVIVCPLVDATTVGQLYPSDVRVAAPEGGLTSDSVVLTGQLRAIAREKLVHHLGELSESAMRQVDTALRITLDLD
jgi:mRNA interferase MazF